MKRLIATTLVPLFVLLTNSTIATEFELRGSLDLSTSDTSAQDHASEGSTYDIPYFPSTTDRTNRQGFVRIANLSDLDGAVSIAMYDDSGQKFGPITLTIEARQTVHLNSVDLEEGDEDKGLPKGVGQPSRGDWRLHLMSDLDIKVFTYIRTPDDFLTSMHDVVLTDGSTYMVGFFNPASETDNESSLRLVNPNMDDVSITITGVDDRGIESGEAKLTITPNAARTISAAELEDGGANLQGSLGNGSGRWRLRLESDQPILAVNLLTSPTGHLANLSTDPAIVGTLATPVDSQPPAPAVEVVSDREIRYSWTWQVEANVSYAFDHGVRTPGGDWLSYCNTARFNDSGEKTITATFRNTQSLPADTVIEARYRYRNSSSCSTGSPGPWSAIGSATVGEDSDDGGSPDLAISSVSMSDTSVDTGDSVTLSATVRNSGDGNSDSSVLRYFRSTNARITTVDTEIGSDKVGGLAAGAEFDGSFQFSAPTSAGTYYYGVCVDEVANESSTTNNCSTAVRLEVVDPTPSGSPDLVIQSIQLSDVSLNIDQSFTINATVRNQGDGQSPATTLRYLRSSNATITTRDAEVGSDSVRSLGSGADSDESIALTAPSAAGIYYYGVCVDSVADESDTGNNCSPGVRVEVVDPATSAAPDLVIQSIQLSNVSLNADQSFTINATVRNQGDGQSPSTTLRYLRSSNATITTRDTEVGSDAVRSLGSGADSDESIALTAPSTAGTYYYGVCVDSVADESDTGNNCSPGVRVEVSGSSGSAHGAIAYDFTLSDTCPGLAVGIATNRSSAAAASIAARSACVSDGGSSSECATDILEFAGCAAMWYGESNTGCQIDISFSNSLRSTLEGAESHALNTCRSEGLSSCRIWVNGSGRRISGCNSQSGNSSTRTQETNIDRLGTSYLQHSRFKKPL